MEKRKIKFITLVFIIIIAVSIGIGIGYLINSNIKKDKIENSQIGNIEINSSKENTNNINNKGNYEISNLNYFVDLSNAKTGDKIENRLNDDFTVLFDVKNSNEELIWDLYVNGGEKIYSDSTPFIEDTKNINLIVIGNYLLYTNHDFTDIRNERLFIINKKGEIVKEIYELDEKDKGLVYIDFDFPDKNYLNIKASRLSHGLSVVSQKHHGANITIDAIKEIPASTVVEAIYKYKINQDGSIDFNKPKIEIIKTFEQFVEENKEEIKKMIENEPEYDEKILENYANRNTTKQGNNNTEEYGTITAKYDNVEYAWIYNGNNTKLAFSDAPNEGGLSITNIIKNSDNTYTIKGVVYNEYKLTDSEIDKLNSNGFIFIYGKKYERSNTDIENYIELTKCEDKLEQYDPYYIYHLDKEKRTLTRPSWQWDTCYRITDVHMQIKVDANVFVLDRNESAMEKGSGCTIDKLYKSRNKYLEYDDESENKSDVSLYNFVFKDGKCIEMFGIPYES